MRVVINRTLTLGQKTGIGHYTAELLRCLGEQTASGEIVGFPDGWFWIVGQALSRTLLARGEKGNTSSGNKNGSLLRSLRQRWTGSIRRAGQAYLRNALRRCLKKHACDLYHEPNTIPLPCDVPALATLHDLSVFLYPEWHPAGRVKYFEENLGLLKGAAHFIAVSEFTRQEAIRQLNLPPERITRVYQGTRPGLAPLPAEDTVRRLTALGLPPRFLLYVGTIEPRKNLLMLLKAYCSLPNQLRELAPLVLAGGWGWGSAPVAEFFHDHARHQGVIHPGYVSDADLLVLYSGARALLYPSFYEGFGLPPLEMMSCGGAVLASPAGAVAEVVGRRALLIDADDQDGWRQAMIRILEDDDYWLGLRHGVREHAKPFTWDRCAAETLQVYRMLCDDLPQRRAA